MLYLALFDKKPTATTQETLARRLEFTHPADMHVVAEYWLTGDKPQVITIFEVESMAPIMATKLAWDDLYECTVFPVITAEEGLKLAQGAFAMMAVPA